jgi:transposase-like protein
MPMPKMQTAYTKEFKLKTIKDYMAVSKTINIHQFAKGIPMPAGTLYNWFRIYFEGGEDAIKDTCAKSVNGFRDIKKIAEVIKEVQSEIPVKNTENKDNYIIGINCDENGTLKKEIFECDPEITERGYYWLLKDTDSMRALLKFLDNLEIMTLEVKD